MGKVVMPKNSAVPKEILAALKIYYEADDWLKNDEFILALKGLIGGDQYHSSYTKKVQMLSYFGFAIWEDPSNAQSKRRITASGKRFYRAWEANYKDAVLEELMYSLEHMVFGRNNCGCSDSDSDIEIPSVFIRAILELGYLTYSEFAFLLWKMADCGITYTDALAELVSARSRDTLSLTEDAKKYTDAKPIMMLIRWGFLAEEGKIGASTKIVIAQDVLSKFKKRLQSLKIYNVDKDLELDEPLPSKANPDEQKAKFKAWMRLQPKVNGEPYSANTIDSYVSNMSRAYHEFGQYRDYDSVFQIQDSLQLKQYTDFLYSQPGFDEFNDRAGNRACSCGFGKYSEFLKDSFALPALRFRTGLKSKFFRNRILFGAPGTGKSFTLNKERKELLGEDNDVGYERVTFHPEYSYAGFVGAYKPVPCKDSGGEDIVTYEYVPGPFMRIYVQALKNGRTDDMKPFLLIVEEINRASVSAVFGDIFQLLDRDDDEVSEYPIQASQDMKKYLASQLGGSPEDYKKIKLPDNMFIWATMNSADQGVFPMDTAFKRRWEFTYLGIDESEAGIAGKSVLLGEDNYKRYVEWNQLRKAINNKLSALKVNEDKLLGPYFLSKKLVCGSNEIDAEQFRAAFKHKVLMYLFEDAAKQKRASLFAEGVDTARYSSVCRAFEQKGVFVFCTEISNQFPAAVAQIDTEGEPE